MKIDLFEFARLGGEAAGELPLERMQRVDTPDRRDAMTWKAAVGAEGRRGFPRLDLEIDGAIPLICQRCLQPMTQVVAIRSRFLIVADEPQASALDDDDTYDAIVGATDFDLDALIEDEVILALPIAPRHEVCPDESANFPYREKKPSPFAGLAVLKTGARGGHGADGGDDGR